MLARRSRAEVGDHLGRAAVRLARKQPVEIALVERREPSARCDGGSVEGRQDDNAPAHVARLDLAGEFPKRDLPLIFVTVVAGDEERCRPLAIADAGDRDGDRSIGGEIAREGQPQAAVLLAVAFEIDRTPEA